MQEFFKTLLWHDLLPLALAVYFGTVLQGFLESLVNHILVPLINHISSYFFGHLKTKSFEVEKFVVKTLTLFIACVVLYAVIKLIIKYIEKV